MNNDQLIFEECTAMGIPEAIASMVIAQARHESANYTSDVFLNSNNAFGYKYAGSKLQTGTYKGYGVYETIKDSASEMCQWLTRRQAEGKFNIEDLVIPQLYATAIKSCGYFEDTVENYTAGMTAALPKIQLDRTEFAIYFLDKTGYPPYEALRCFNYTISFDNNSSPTFIQCYDENRNIVFVVSWSIFAYAKKLI